MYRNYPEVIKIKLDGSIAQKYLDKPAKKIPLPTMENYKIPAHTGNKWVIINTNYEKQNYFSYEALLQYTNENYGEYK